MQVDAVGGDGNAVVRHLALEDHLLRHFLFAHQRRLSKRAERRRGVNDISVLKADPVLLQVLQNLLALTAALNSALCIILRAVLAADIAGHLHAEVSFPDQREEVNRTIGDLLHIRLVGRDDVLDVSHPEHQRHGALAPDAAAFGAGHLRDGGSAGAVDDALGQDDLTPGAILDHAADHLVAFLQNLGELGVEIHLYAVLRHQLIGGELERLGIPRRDLQIVFAARGVERIILVRADQVVAANRAALFDHTRDQLVENALDQDLVAGDRHARLAVCNISVCQQSAQRTEVLD